jgi:phospholipase/carboxylesterase
VNLIHTIYEPSGDVPHPTILTLHGRGANALDLLGLAPHICNGKFLMICPQGPLETPIGPGVVGYAWYPMSMGGPPDVGAILSSRKKLQAFLDECLARYPIDAKKLVILGFSQGGVMAYSLALSNPERFAGLVVLSSWLPKELIPDLAIKETVQSLPTLVQHGSQDQMIEVQRAQDSVERLRELRVPLTYREYNMVHEITPRGLTDLSAWLEEKVLSPIVIAS